MFGALKCISIADLHTTSDITDICNIKHCQIHKLLKSIQLIDRLGFYLVILVNKILFLNY